jgi:predicted Zn-dependent protease
MARDDADLAGIVKALLSKAEAQPEVDEAEAYASWNAFTMARIESLAHRGRTVEPSVQQLKRLESVGASVRVVMAGAVGQSSTRDLSSASIDRLVERAVGSSRIMAADPNFVSLPMPLDRPAPRLPRDHVILDGPVEDDLAEAAEAAISVVGGTGLELAGSIMAVGSEIAVANTHGVDLFGETDTFTVAQFTVERMEGPRATSSGMGWSSGRRIADLDPEDATNQGMELASKVPERTTVPEGDYNVILGQYAVADVLDNMMPYSMNLEPTYLGMSWLPTEPRPLTTGKEAPHPLLGEQVAVEGFSLMEDPTLENGMLSHSHDDEGLPTRKVEIINDGYFEDIIGSAYWSYLYGREPTGSGLRKSVTPGRCAGAQPSGSGTNLVVEPGDMSLEELVEVSEGPTLFIPRTWYTYPTRFGAPGFSSSNRATSFLVEGSELVPVAPNAFKLSGDIGEMLKSIYGIGKEVKTATTWIAMRAPIVPMMACRGIRVSKPAGDV